MHDLHIHLGGAVPTAVLWEILCDSGLQTEFETFDALQEYLTAKPEDIRSLDDFLGQFFHASEFIQSSPAAAATASYQLVAKAYRRAKIESVEVRFNPLKRLRRGLHTMDSILLATIQGLQRASVHYPVKTGIILSLGRDLSIDDNARIIDYACEFATRGALHGAWGVVGIDLAGPESRRNEADPDWLAEAEGWVGRARDAGLGVTWHVGETPDTGPEILLRVLERLRPDRIGHGIEYRKAAGAQRARLTDLLRETGATLELCPTVNLITRSIADYGELAGLIRDLARQDLRYCLNTDNPYLIKTNLQREHDLMAGALGADAGPLLARARACAVAASFLRETVCRPVPRPALPPALPEHTD